MPRLTISDLQATAAARGGMCLSQECMGALVKHLWRCTEGHEWKATPAAVRQGSWCPRCAVAARSLDLADLQAIALTRGGTCLSPTCLGANQKHRWRCKEGHEWEATPHSIKDGGSWCPFCAGAIVTLEDLHAAARERGGRCLTPTYLGARTKHRWQCAEGHEWDATADAVKRGAWCRLCANDELRLHVDDLHLVAKAKGGLCLSTSYLGIKAPHKWRCAKGHEWEATADAVRRGTWCPICARVDLRLSIHELQDLAEERGGLCLTKVYSRSDRPVHWRCAEGHEWDATASRVRRGTWCPTCVSPRYRLFLAMMQSLARGRGGQCLESPSVKGSRPGPKTVLSWCCAEGHEWKMSPRAIWSGRWCPVCTADDRPQNPDTLIATARYRGGVYHGEPSPEAGIVHRWRCAVGHEWIDNPSEVWRGTWCPTCERLRQKEIPKDLYSEEALSTLARSNGGRCLGPASSFPKRGLRYRFRWRCAKGHEWEASPENIAWNEWCPECLRRRNKGRKKPIAWTVESLGALAKSKGGRFLSRTYRGSTVNHRWRCAAGHEWEATPSRVGGGSWCRKCAHERRKLTISDLQKMAADQRGVCLSQDYLGIHKAHQWRCRLGHEWEASVHSIRKGSWCPKCWNLRRGKTIAVPQNGAFFVRAVPPGPSKVTSKK